MYARRILSYACAGSLLLHAIASCATESKVDPADDDSHTNDESSMVEDAGDEPESSDAALMKDAKTSSDAGNTARADATVEASAAADAAVVRDAKVETPVSGSDAGLEQFSFFVSSLKAMRQLSKSEDGFGGDLRFGETGEGAGLRGADKICTTIAEQSMPGSGAKVWRAFLSTTTGGADGGPVHAIDRVGEGPWYDRLGRVVALNKADLVQTRPASANALIKNDLPNEDGVPNHAPDGTQVDNHDILTGTNDKGQLYKDDVRVTCNDWTKSEKDADDAPRVGHSWPRGGGGGRGGSGGGTDNWMSALNEAGCGASVGLIEMGPPKESDPTVGSGGGYGGIYCFALTP